MERDLPFVDAHVHLWDLRRLRYPWLTSPFSDDGPNGSVEAIARNYLLEDYLADLSGWDVRGIVHIDAGAAPEAALAETEWLQTMTDARGMPNAIIAFAALDDPDVGTLLAAHAAHSAVRGIRHIVNWHPDPRRSYLPRDITRDEAWAQGFALLKKHGLSFDLQAYPGQFYGLARLIARHPEVQVILNHTGMAFAGAWEEWRSGMRALAALPNVACKISGMGFTYRPWVRSDVRPYVLEAIDIFGSERVMFASNSPTDKLFGGVSAHLDAYDSITSGFSNEDRLKIFASNANKIYRLGIDLQPNVSN